MDLSFFLFSRVDVWNWMDCGDASRASTACSKSALTGETWPIGVGHDPKGDWWKDFPNPEFLTLDADVVGMPRGTSYSHCPLVFVMLHGC